MRLLIINFDTAHSQSLRVICSRYDVIYVTSLSQASAQEAGSYDAVVMAGTYDGDDTEIAQAAIDFVKQLQVPMLGICYGFQLLCAAHGVDLDDLGERNISANRITPTDDGAKLFQGSDPMLAEQTVRWQIEELPKALVVLARSETGIEAIRHKTLPMYGLQLYPEDFSYLSDAKLVYGNILASFVKRGG